VPFQFFRIPAQNLNAAGHELNRFLRSHHVQTIERHFIEQGEQSFWLFSVEYQEQAGGRSSGEPAANASESSASTGAGGTRRKERIDYRDKLSEEDFQLYVGLKKLREQLADEEKLAIYLIFTNDQLAKLAESKPRTTEDLKQIEGVGPAKIEKYGARVLEWFKHSQGDRHETSRATVSENPGAGKPAAGHGESAAGKAGKA
jgi:superfamily II DNA helicase RecQ